jgi:hypothetical protein
MHAEHPHQTRELAVLGTTRKKMVRRLGSCRWSKVPFSRTSINIGIDQVNVMALFSIQLLTKYEY